MSTPVSIGSIITYAQSQLNDQVGATYTPAVLLPYIQMALDHLRLEFQGSNIPFINKTTQGIVINQGQTDLGGSNGPALPLDFVEPMELWERTAGTADDYMQMARRQFLPKTQQITSFLEVWSYQEQIIKFLGANNNVEIKMDYIADNIGNALNENSQIRITNAKLFLSFKSASFAARFIGENGERADSLDSHASYYLDLMMSIGVKSQQSISTRRRPFMAGYKARGGYGSW